MLTRELNQLTRVCVRVKPQELLYWEEALQIPFRKSTVIKSISFYEYGLFHASPSNV